MTVVAEERDRERENKEWGRGEDEERRRRRRKWRRKRGDLAGRRKERGKIWVGDKKDDARLGAERA